MKTLIVLLCLSVLACGDVGGDKPGFYNDDLKLTGSYDPITRCVTLQWEPVDDAFEYRIQRFGMRSDVEKRTKNLSFTNCYDDSGDWAFGDVFGHTYYGDFFIYSVDVYVIDIFLSPFPIHGGESTRHHQYVIWQYVTIDT